jgi:hypothetical protein
MVPPSTLSRRILLASVGTGLATALAGCSGSDTHQSSSDDGTLVNNHVTKIARSSSKQPPIIASRENTDSAENDEETSSPAESLTRDVIETENDAADLEFAEEATNIAAVRRLVAETAYANESVLLYQTRIRECYQLQLNYITRDDVDGDPHVEFCQVIREAEVECERNARNHVAAAVRLPFSSNEYGGFSVGSGGSCDPIPERYQNESESP